MCAVAYALTRVRVHKHKNWNSPCAHVHVLPLKRKIFVARFLSKFRYLAANARCGTAGFFSNRLGSSVKHDTWSVDARNQPTSVARKSKVLARALNRQCSVFGSSVPGHTSRDLLVCPQLASGTCLQGWGAMSTFA